MDMDKKMRPVIREISGIVNCDGDTTKAIEVRNAVTKWSLDESELRYLCRYFGLLTEDVR